MEDSKERTMPVKSFSIFACLILLVLVMGVTGAFSGTSVSQSTSQDQILLAQSRERAGGRTDSAEMHNQEGLAAFSAGNYQEAVRHYNEAIRVDPDNAKAYNNRGVTYNKMGRHNLAISDYNKALELNPRFAEAYQNRALAHFRAQNYAQSCSDLKQYRQMGGMPSPEFVKDLENSPGIGRC
jgi:Tfp pilus assembly protein PilF